MSEWYCFKCKEKMEEAALVINYMDVDAEQTGIKCPKCGTIYLLERTVVEEVRNNEDELDAK